MRHSQLKLFQMQVHSFYSVVFVYDDVVADKRVMKVNQRQNGKGL